MSRLRAETMPAVTVPPRLKGLPMAMTHSPSRSLSESPNATALSGLSAFTRNSAKSALVSLPTSCAGSLVPSLRMTLISSASAMTWLLVTTRPDGSMTKPEPSELTRRGAWSGLSPPPCPRRFLKNSSKNSSIGEPGGRSGMPVTRASTFCEVEMLTTASITCSATSAMFSGPRAAAGGAVKMTTATISAATAAPCRTNCERWREVKWRDMDVGAPARGLDLKEKCPRRAPGARPYAAGSAIRDPIGAEKRPANEPFNHAHCRSTTHKVDDQHADQRRNDAGDTQRAVGHFQHRRHGALGADRKCGKKDALDREEQAERGEEIGHEAGNSLPLYFVALLALGGLGAAAVPGAGAAVFPPCGNDLPD